MDSNSTMILFLIAMVATPLGKEINGARRWHNIAGIQFQPAEIAKLAVIVFIPMLIIKMGRQFRSRGNRTVGYYLVVAAIVEDTDDGTVFHGIAAQVPHALLRTLAAAGKPISTKRRKQRAHRAELKRRFPCSA